MTNRRRALVFLMALILSLGSVVALATEKIAKPEVSYRTKNTTVTPGTYCDIKIKLAAPGFLTVRLLDTDENELAVLFEDWEVSSGEHIIPWLGRLPDGSAPAPGKYMIACVLRDEYGNESKAARQTITISEAAPIISEATIRYSPNSWMIDFVVDQPGVAGATLHSARDIDTALMDIITDFKHDGGLVSMSWDGHIQEKNKDTNQIESVSIYPGRYAVKVYSFNENGVECEPYPIYVIVGSDGGVILTDASGTPLDGSGAATASSNTPATDNVGANDAGTDETSPAEGNTTAAGGNTLTNGDGGDTAPADGGTADAPEGTADGAATDTIGTQTSNTAQLGQTVSGVSVVDPQNASVGAGVADYAQQTTDNYWNLQLGNMDDAAIWQALIAPMYVCKIGESDHFYLLDEPSKYGKRIGELHGTTCGVNVLYTNSDGWSLAEAYRDEDGAFMRGWVDNSRLKEVKVNQNYGLVMDKRAQTLTLYQDGRRVDTIRISTGLAEEKYELRETPAGEFILGTRIGTKDQAGIGKCDYHLRISGGILMHGQPYKTSGGEKVYEWTENLGAKHTRGTVVVQSVPNAGQELSMEYIWDKLPKDMKLLILDDKDRSVIPYE